MLYLYGDDDSWTPIQEAARYKLRVRIEARIAKACARIDEARIGARLLKIYHHDPDLACEILDLLTRLYGETEFNAIAQTIADL